MSELNDYSGPFKPDLTFDDFSKDFLLKLMTVWQYAWIRMSESWYTAVSERFGADAANDCNMQAWVKVAERVNPRYPKVANFQLNTVLDSLEVSSTAFGQQHRTIVPGGVRHQDSQPRHHEHHAVPLIDFLRKGGPGDDRAHLSCARAEADGEVPHEPQDKGDSPEAAATEEPGRDGLSVGTQTGGVGGHRIPMYPYRHPKRS